MAPRKYLEEFLHSCLDEHVSSFDESSLEIGVLVGDVQLSHLQLKTKTWEVSPGLWVELVHGSIDRVHLEVPWMELRKGGVKGSVEKCNVVLKLRASEYDEDQLAHECLMFAEKMNQLDEQEMKLLSEAPESWVSRTMGSISSNFLSQLATGFSLHIENFHCSLLLPNGNEFDDEVFDHSYLHVSAHFDALDIGQLQTDGSKSAPQPSSLFFTKEVSLRGLNIRVGENGIECPNNADEFRALANQLGSTDMFVNPMHVALEVKGELHSSPSSSTSSSSSMSSRQDGSGSGGDKELGDGQRDVKLITLDFTMSNFEATPKVEQLRMLKTVVDHVQFARSRSLARSKIWHLHPLYKAARANPQLAAAPRSSWPKVSHRDLWKFAYNSVLVFQRESIKKQDRQRTSSTVGHSNIKGRYAELYRRVIENGLLESADDESSGLLYDEQRQLYDMHKRYSSKTLLGFRTAVHKSLRNAGVSTSELQRALCSVSSSARIFAQELRVADEKLATVNPDSGKDESQADQDEIIWNVNVSISRFAIAILSPASELHESSGEDPTLGHGRAFTILLYGFKLEKQAGAITMAVGSARAYGLSHHEIFLCGGEPDSWLQSGDANKATAVEAEKALSLTYKIIEAYDHVDDIDEELRSPTTDSQAENTEDEKDTVCLSKISVATLHVHWHQNSMNFFRDLCDTIASTTLTMGETSPLTKLLGDQGFPVKDLGEINGSSTSQRWNLKVNFEGLHFSILNFENGPSGSKLNCASPNENRYAVIRVGKISARGGDYTQRWLESAKDTPDPTDQEEALRTTVRAIQDPNVSTFVYKVDFIEILLVNDPVVTKESDVKITRLPWSLSGALSLSKRVGDERYPEARADILCSRLDLILSVGSTITMIGCVNQVAETLFALQEDVEQTQKTSSGKKARVGVPKAAFRQRIKSLAPISKFFLNVRFSTSNIALTSDQPNVDHLKFSSEILSSFAERVKVRGEMSQVMETKRRLLLVQMQKLGVKEKDANQIIDTLVQSIYEDESIDRAIQFAVGKIADLTQNLIRLRNAPIVELHIGKCKVMLNQLTYDHKFTVEVKRLLVTGPSQIPLLQVHRVGSASEKSNAKAKAKKEKEGTRPGMKKGRRDSEVKENAEDIERATMSISIEYVETDAGYNFGLGDSHVFSMMSQGHTINKREGRLKLKADTVNLILQTDIIPVIGKMMHASERINSYLVTLRSNRKKSTETFATHFERKSSHSELLIPSEQSSNAPARSAPRLKSFSSGGNRGNSPPDAANAKTAARLSTSDGEFVSTSPRTSLASQAFVFHLSVELRSIDVILSHDDNLLALLMLNKGSLTLDFDLQFMSGEIFSHFDAIRLYDLSEVGSLHPLVIWHKVDSTSAVLDMGCFIEKSKKDNRLFINLDVNLTGLRVCLLYRFLQELVGFSTLFQSMYADMIKGFTGIGAVDADAVHALEEDLASVSQSGDDDETESSEVDSSDSEDSDASSYSSSDESSDVHVRVPFSAGSAMKPPHGSHSAHSGDFVGPKKDEAPGKKLEAGAGYQEKQLASNQVFRWKIHLKDFVVVCPRNSSSSDLLALTVGSGTVGNLIAKSTWEAPTAAELKEPHDRKLPIVFDPLTNVWMRKGEQDDGFSMSSFDFPLVSEPSSSFGTESFYAESRYHSAHNTSYHSDSFGTPKGSEKSPRGRAEVLEHPETPREEGNAEYEGIFRLNLGLEHISAYTSLSGVLTNYEHNGEILIDTEKLKEFLEVHDGNSVYHIKHKKRIADTSQQSNAARGSQQYWRKVSLVPFNLLTVADFLDDNTTRILMSDTDILSPLALNVTMAEFCLIESVWFDNILEAPAFFSKRQYKNASADKLSAEKDSNEEATNSDTHETRSRQSNETPASSESGGKSSSSSSRRTSEIQYGTKEYFRALRQQVAKGEFVLVRADIKIECFMDVDYFAMEPPSLKFLRAKEILEQLDKEMKEGGSRSAYLTGIKLNETCKTFALPLAKVSIEGLVLHQRALKNNSSELALGAGLVEIFDTRVPKTGVYEKALRVGTLDLSPGQESKRLYGYADFDFGLKLLPSDITSNGDLPLKLTVFNTDFWTTTNVGIDGLELNVKNLELILLVVDFFACFYQYPEFGHPSVAAFKRLPESKIPYRGVDTRVFATRPQICIMENPLVPHSATLVLESEAGVFYRQIIDNKQSTRIEVKALDVALVAHQRFSGHDRGLRGSAGSGTGIRTLVENLDCDYSQHFISATNHMDIQFCMLENSPTNAEPTKTTDDQPLLLEAAGDFPSVLPLSNAGESDNYVDFESERLFLKPVELFSPKCNNKLHHTMKKDFPERCCHLVTSYEDLLFSVNMITEFINGKPEVDEDEKAANKKSKRKGASKEKDKKAAKLTIPFDLFTTVSIYGVRAVVVDNILGLHLPLLQIFLKDLKLTFEQTTNVDQPVMVRRRSRSNAAEAITPRSSAPEGGLPTDAPLLFEEKDPTNLKAYGKISVWSDYFNNLKKCWEPLLEKVIASLMYEKSALYGQGITFRTESAIHVNISGAFFRTLNDLVRMYQSSEASSGAGTRSESTESVPARAIIEEAVVSTRMERKLPPIQWCPVLPEGARFGFALQNSTGQPLRFVQQRDGGKNTISFIDDGERGALNFVATTTRIRNDVIVRDAFNVQQDHRYNPYTDDARAGTTQSRTKKSLCLQISGYKAIPSVEADQLGVKYEDLVPVDNERRSKREQIIKSMDGKVQNALKLVAEVVSLNRGRLLHLRSVFTVKNNTSHTIEVRASLVNSGPSSHPDVFFTVNSGDNLYIPIGLLQRCARESGGNALGFLKIRPANQKPVEDELGSDREDIQMGMDIEYSSDNVDLHEIVQTNSWLRSSAENERLASIGSSNSGQVLTDVNKTQLCCLINPKLKKKTAMFDSKGPASINSNSTPAQSHSNKLPLFCYNMEIQRIGDSETSSERSKAKLGVIQAALTGRLFQAKEDRADTKIFTPVHYNIVVHPPIVLESLLPWHGHFEILHANTSRLLWSSLIEPGKAKPIHTVTLDEPLRLRIHLKYCRTGSPVLFHTPHEEHAGRTFVGTINDIQKTVEGFLVETDGNGEDASVELADSQGQRLRLNIENVEGGGGERQIVVYCPYWIVNTSQYKLRLREEGSHKDHLPAGTVTVTKNGTVKDGTRPVAYGSVKQWPEEMGMHTIFPGKIPPLHQSHRENGQIPNEDELRNMLLDLPFDEVVKYAYMFNYPDVHSIGKRRVCVQIDDSDWSQGFSLDSVGTPIPLSIEHPDKGLLELGYKIKVAPGRLGKYTKIVRFMPRFVIMNRLEFDFKLLQPTGFVGDLLPVDVKAKHFICYHLPSVFGERSLAIELEGPWNRTVFFDIEAVGTSTLRVMHKLDLAKVDHVNTRGLPNYEVTLRPEDDIGIWFETDWEEKNIVVKSFRHGSFAHEETDIQIGDVVIGYNQYYIEPSDPFYDKDRDKFEEISGRDFERLLKLLKERDAPIRLKIRTVEENIRILRRDQQSAAELINKYSSKRSEEYPAEIALRLEIRQVEATIFIVVDAVDKDVRSEYMLENYSVSHVIHYKQKGVPGNNWCSLAPGQSVSYIWEDPFKPHKLLLKAGRNILSPKSVSQIDSDFFPGDILNRTQGILEFIAGVAADEITVISLDEIGTKDREVALPNGAEGKLYASVNIKNGATKTLIISPDRSSQPQQTLELAYCSTFLKIQHDVLTALYSRCLIALKEKERIQLLTGQDISAYYMPLFAQAQEELKRRQEDIKDELRDALRSTKKDHQDFNLSSYLPFESLWGQRIERKHQVLVEVLEAKDLRQFVIGKLEDTYCSVQLRTGTSIFQGQAQPKYTNVCEQNMNPLWIGQRFIFDVPDFDDVSTKIKARDVKIRVNVMSKTVIRPFHRFLGQADIQFSCLKTSAEEEVKGYFLLRPQAPSITAAKMIDVSGSIKIRLQWIHSDEGLIKYNLSCISNRLAELQELGRVLQKLYQVADAQNLAKSDNMLNLFHNDRAKQGMNIQSIASGTLSLAGGIAGGTLSLAGGIAGAAARMPGEIVRGLIRKSAAVESDSNKEMLTVDNFVPTRSSFQLENPSLLAGKDPSAVQAEQAKVPAPTKLRRGISALPRVRAFTKFSHAVNPEHGLDADEDAAQFNARRRAVNHEQMENGSKQPSSVTSLEEKSEARPRFNKYRIVSKVMERRVETIQDCDHFSRRFEEECRASYLLTHTQKGKLVITPLAAHNLPEKHNRKVSVRITYGDVEKSTQSKSNSADLSWGNEEVGTDAGLEGRAPTAGDADDGHPIKEDKKSIQKVFDIETLNIKSSLLVQVMAEGIRKRKEIARVEIPIFNLLDCLCHAQSKSERDGKIDRNAVKVEDNVYEMWFAMLPTDECILGEGDIEDLKNEMEQQDYMAFSKGSEYKPCIQLRFRFVQREGDEGKTKEAERSSSKFFRLQMPSFSVSIIDSVNARELMQCSILGIDGFHAISNKYTNSSLNAMWLQVDNQLPDPTAAIVLAPTPTKYPEPTIRINIRKDNELSREGLTSYDFIVVKVETLDLSLEQQTVVASWALIKNWFHEQAAPSGDGTDRGKRRDSTFNDLDQLGFATCKEFTQYDLYDLLPTLAANSGAKNDIGSKRTESKLYISFINITSVRINVSFIMNPQIQQSGQKVEKMQHASWSDDIDLLSSVTFFLSQIGVVALDLTSSISDAPITFAEFQREKIFETDTEVEKRLRQHYLYSALTQLYKIVGSLELVGNPVGLVTSLGIGVTDFFYEPYHALITNPTDIGKLGRGLAKGTLSVVSNTTEGMIGTGTTFTRTVGRIGARLAMDPTYVVAREELHRQPRTPAEAISRPLKDIGNGVYYGVVGLVKVPYNSYRRNKALGIVPGIAKGVAGLFAKSVVGVVDAITHTGDAVRELVRTISRDQTPPVRRLRLRNQFGPDGRLLPYSYLAALGMHVLQALDRARLESMGNAINESVGFVTSLGRFLSISDSQAASRRALGRRNSISGPEMSPRSRSRSASSATFDINDLHVDSQDGKPPPGWESGSPGVDGAKHEFVVHTFMKRNNRVVEKRSAESFQLVIVTTARVLVADYTKKKRGASQFVRRWEAQMQYLKSPKLEKRKAGGYLLTLGSTKVADTETLTALVKGPIIKLRKTASKQGAIVESARESNDFTIESTLTEDDGSVLELYNCITIAKTHTDLTVGKLEQTKIQYGVVSYGENIECDDEGIFKIGQWEYSNFQFDEAESLLESKNAHLTSDLEATGWNLLRSHDGSAREKALSWLEDERRICINAHKFALQEQTALHVLPYINSEESMSSTSEAEAGDAAVRKAPTGYLKGSLQAAQSVLASSARTIGAAVNAVSSVALSPAVTHRGSNSAAMAKPAAEEAAPAAETGTTEALPSLSPRSIMSSGLSPKGAKKGSISFELDSSDKASQARLKLQHAESTSTMAVSPLPTLPEHTAVEASKMTRYVPTLLTEPPALILTQLSLPPLPSLSPIFASPNTSLAAGMFSPYSAPHTVMPPAAAAGGGETARHSPGSPQSDAGSFATLLSEAASQAGTLNTQDSEAMAALHGRLDRLEQLLMAALSK